MPFFLSDIFYRLLIYISLLKEFSKLFCFEDFQNISKIPSNGGPTFTNSLLWQHWTLKDHRSFMSDLGYLVKKVFGDSIGLFTDRMDFEKKNL